MQAPPPQANVTAFFKFIQERHNIYLRRQAGQPWPWTKDHILQKYRFCNIFRELDTVTIWIRENWREPFALHRNLWFAMAMARQINWPPTLEEIGFPRRWRPEKVLAILKHRRARRLKTYTGAYMLTGSLPGCADKPEITVEILDRLYRDPPPLEKSHTLENAFHLLKGKTGFGKFLAYEVVTDLRWTHYLRYAPDIMTWANAGPGAKRGLNRIWNRRPKENLKSSQALEEMKYLLNKSKSCLPENFPSMEMRDIEHSLCEFDKYQRVLLGQGKMRSRYKTQQNLLT